MEENGQVLLEVKNLKTYFFYDEGTVIFQEPMTFLAPVYTIEDQIMEAILYA